MSDTATLMNEQYARNREGTSENTPAETTEFYKDMRFWLVLLMIAAFLAFILLRYPV